MASKKQHHIRKESTRQQSNLARPEDQQSYQRVRVIQKNLIFVNGLPADLSEKELLETEVYFSRYGSIVKMIVNPSYPCRKIINYQAYVTYENELDASLAIVVSNALDGFKISNDRTLKVSYGTTKYCSHFLKGHQCPNYDCLYLHKLDKKRQVINGAGNGNSQFDISRNNLFKEQNSAAIDNVLNCLQEVVKRSINQISLAESQSYLQGFPTISEVLDFLVQISVLTQSKIQKVKQKVLSGQRKSGQKQEQKSIKKKYEQKGGNKEREDSNESNSCKDRDDSMPKDLRLVRSSSFSTTCSPSKPQSLLQPQMVQPQQQSVKLEQNGNLNSLETLNRQSVAILGKQKFQYNRGQNSDQKIEKLLIRELLTKEHQCKSRFAFAIDKTGQNNSSTKKLCTYDQSRKIKGIFQKYLIAKN